MEAKKPKKTITVDHQDQADETPPKIEVAQRSILRPEDTVLPDNASHAPGAPEVDAPVEPAKPKTDDQALSEPLKEIAERAKRVKEAAEASKAETPEPAAAQKESEPKPVPAAAPDSEKIPVSTTVQPKPEPKPELPAPKPVEKTPAVPEAEPATDTEVFDDIPEQNKPTPTDAQLDPAEAADKAAIKQAAEHEAAIQKLVDSKQYYLPIKTVEQRRSQRNVIYGVLFTAFLIAAWLNIALDAGLIELGRIQPVTNFFSK